MTEQLIVEEAISRAEKCTSQTKDIYRLAFAEGALWIKEKFLPSSIPIKRDNDGKVTQEFLTYLCELPCNIGIIFIEPQNKILHFLDPEQHCANNYAVFDILSEVNEVFIVNID